MSSFDDRLRGMIVGQALGDAVGLSTSGRSPQETFKVVFPYKDAVANYTIGDWSSHMDMSIGIMEMMSETDLLTTGKFNTNVYAKKLVDWCAKGYPECSDTKGVGMGVDSIMVVSDVDFIDNPIKVSKRFNKKSAPSNDALMRAPVMGMCNLGSSDIDKFMDNVRASTQVTSYDSRCTIASWTISLICRQLLLGERSLDALYTRTMNTVMDFAGDLPPVEYLSIHGDPFMGVDGYDGPGEYSHYMGDIKLSQLQLDKTPINYVYKTMGCGVWALGKTNFKSTISELALCCGGANANCNIAGAIIGATIGYSQLPQDWITSMPYHQWLNERVDVLLYDLKYSR